MHFHPKTQRRSPESRPHSGAGSIRGSAQSVLQLRPIPVDASPLCQSEVLAGFDEDGASGSLELPRAATA